MDAEPLDQKRSADELNWNAEPLDQKRSADELNRNDQKVIQTVQKPRNYTKKAVNVVTNPDVLAALKHMADSVYTYRRNPFVGEQLGNFRYAFYYGKLNSNNAIGLITTIVLSSEKKVYNITNINEVIEMNWNQDPSTRGKKRGYGHIYLGKLAGEKGFETYLADVFVSELGIHI
jgi:hypothetical protein